MRKLCLLSLAAVVGLATSAVASGDFDFGKFRDLQLRAHSNLLFGLSEPHDLVRSRTAHGLGHHRRG